MKNFNMQRLPKLREFYQVLQKFIPEVQDDIEISDGDTRMRLVRARDDRMTINVYRIGNDFDESVLFSTIFYTGCEYNDKSYFHCTRNSTISVQYSTMQKDSVGYMLQKNIHEAEGCILKYPLHEEEYFQRMTQYNLPLEEDLEVLMRCGNEWFDGVSEFQGFSLHTYDQLTVQDETKFDNMVQYMVQLLYKLYAENDHKIKS